MRISVKGNAALGKKHDKNKYTRRGKFAGQRKTAQQVQGCTHVLRHNKTQYIRRRKPCTKKIDVTWKEWGTKLARKRIPSYGRETCSYCRLEARKDGTDV